MTSRVTRRMTRAPVALRIALRELRGGLRGFRILILCLSILLRMIDLRIIKPFVYTA